MNALKAILIVIIFGLGGFAWKTLMDKQAVEADFARLEASQMQALKDKQAETQKALAAQAEQHQRAIQQLSVDHEAKLDELRAAQREKMAEAYTEFENIFEGNKKTIDYINALEGKVKSGQDLSKMEIEKLAVITTGLSYLQKQYQKPLQEFGELESYFATQASRQPEKPSSRFRFFKRMFSKNFRESEKEFYREQGAQAAMEEAQTKFTTVYASAQKSMAEVGPPTRTT
jgi:hypothetical protein